MKPSQTEGPFTKIEQPDLGHRHTSQSYINSSPGATGQPRALLGVGDVPRCLGRKLYFKSGCGIIKLCLCYSHGSPQKHSSVLLTKAEEITEASKGHIEMTENLGKFTYWSLSIFFGETVGLWMEPRKRHKHGGWWRIQVKETKKDSSRK